MKITKKLRRQQPPLQPDPEVKLLQRELKALGFDVSLDGKFGPGTEAAVKAAQQALHPAGTPDFDEEGVVDDRLAEQINKAFDETDVGKIIGNRKKKFQNKLDAIAELDAAITAELAKPAPDRLRLDGLYERKYGWLTKKLEEAAEDVWKGIPGYAMGPMKPGSGVAVASACCPTPPESVLYRSSPQRVQQQQQATPIDGGVTEVTEGEYVSLGRGMVFDILYQADPRILFEIAEDMVKTKQDAIDNLEKWLAQNPAATLEERDNARKRIDEWRGRLDAELEVQEAGTAQAAETVCDLTSLLIEFEGLKLNVYQDQAGLDTIGVGHLITNAEKASGTIDIGGQAVPYAGGLTEQQARDLHKQDMKRFEDGVRASVTVPINACQFAALVSLAFNIGLGRADPNGTGFRGSSALKKLNEGKYDEVPDLMRRWNKVGNTVSDGLKRRREREVEVWNGRCPPR
jgi:lysozyme